MEWNTLGHEWAAALLQHHVAQGEVRHAYLFTGPAGVGRRTLALRFAQAVNCPQPPAPGLPCGTCRTCQQIERMQHADLTVVQSEPDSAVLKVEQIRELQHTLSLAPYEARYRVALLRNFQEANANAQNALLKTLEEAPARVILLVTAESVGSLLPTIVSRCEVLRLRPLTLEHLEAELQTRWQVPAQDARLLAHLSGGRVGYALNLLQDPGLLERRQGWLEEMMEMLAANRRDRFAYAEATAKDKDRDKVRQMMQTWLIFWRDVYLRACGAQVALVNLDWAEQIEEMAGQIDPSSARERLSALNQALTRLDANLNLRLLVEVTLLDWPRLRVSTPEMGES